MVVTQLEPFYKGHNRVSIYLNNQFAFVLYEGELSKYGLKVGIDFDDNLYKRILDEVLIPRAKKRGLNLLMKMDRTESDVRSKLQESGYPVEAVDQAIKYLQSFHYIDDFRYASDYIRFKSSSMSRKQIYLKLSQKGITKDIITRAFDEYDASDDESRQASAEVILIRKLINKRLKGNIEPLDYDSKNKLFAYMYNKGFNLSEVESVYEEMLLDITSE